MLLTDNDSASAALLQQLDPEVASVVEAQNRKAPGGLLLEGANSVCENTWGECRSKLEAALTTYTTYVGIAGSQAHNAAVTNIGAPWGSYGTHARIRLNQVVAHDGFYANSLSGLQRWIGYAGLRLLFREVANRLAGDKYGDRYEKKHVLYVAEDKRMWSQVISQGLPFVVASLDAPGSKHGYNAGTWDGSNLSQSADPGNAVLANQQLTIAITYVDQTAYLSPLHKFNAESGPSTILPLNLPGSAQLTVSIASLNPPSTANPPPVGLSQGVAPMLNASGWLVYVGIGGGPLYLQTLTPIPIGTTSYTLSLPFAISGYVLGPGQFADRNLIFGSPLTRG